MADTVYRWLYNNGALDVWQAVVPDHPEVNASNAARFESDQETTPGLMAYIVESWNRQFAEDQRTAEDFVFAEPPVDWVNPNG